MDVKPSTAYGTLMSHSVMECVDWNILCNGRWSQHLRSHSVMECVDWNILCNGRWSQHLRSHSVMECVDWNVGIDINNVYITRSHSVMECVDWNDDNEEDSQPHQVALCNGVRGLKSVIAGNACVHYTSHSVMECVDWKYILFLRAPWGSGRTL